MKAASALFLISKRFSSVISKILIPTDFSPASWKAAQVGLDMLHFNSNATITFLHIVPGSSRYTHSGNSKIPAAQLEEVKHRMNHLIESLVNAEETSKVENLVLSGNVEKTLLSFIHANDFDLVMIGINSSGYDNEIGSHTARIIKESGVPVMIVPNRTPHGAIAS